MQYPSSTVKHCWHYLPARPPAPTHPPTHPPTRWWRSGGSRSTRSKRTQPGTRWRSLPPSQCRCFCPRTPARVQRGARTSRGWCCCRSRWSRPERGGAGGGGGDGGKAGMMSMQSGSGACGRGGHGGAGSLARSIEASAGKPCRWAAYQGQLTVEEAAADWTDSTK